MDHQPLTEPVLLVLLSLVEQPRHGYSIRNELGKISGGRVVLSSGTLYNVLQRLLRRGWIEPVQINKTLGDRCSFCLTSRGKCHLQAEIKRIKGLLRVAAQRNLTS